MDYIVRAGANEDGVERLCKLIGAGQLRKFYQKNPSWFTSVKRGFRAQSLEDDKAIALAVQYSSEHLITDFLNDRVDSLMKSIKKAQDKEAEKGKSDAEALIFAILNSRFKDDPEFYFAMEGFTRSKEEQCAILAAINIAKNHASIPMEQPEKDADTDKYEELKRKAETEKTELENKIQQLQNECELISKKNKDMEYALAEKDQYFAEQNKQLREEKDEAESVANKLKRMQKYVVRGESGLKDPEYPYCSLCRTFLDDGKMKLDRCYDIDNEMISEEANENYPSRRTLYINPKDPVLYPEGHIGVWKWTAKESDQARDGFRYLTEYNVGLQPAEIVCLSDCISDNDLVIQLQQKVEFDVCCDNVLVCYKVVNGYRGIYISKGQFVYTDSQISLKNTVINLPIFEIYNSETILVKGHLLSSKFDFGMPMDIVRVRDPFECIKALFQKRYPQAESKRRGLTTAAHNQMLAYLKELPNKEFVEELATNCDLSESEAIEFVEQFIQRANSYLDASDFEDQMLLAIIRTDPELLQKCKCLLRDEWLAENEELVADADKKLNGYKVEANNEQKRVDDLREQLEAVKHQLQQSNSELAAKEQMAKDVEDKVAERIAAAQKNAAEFIASQAFVGCATSTGSTVSTVTPVNASKYVAGQSIGMQDCETYEGLSDYLDNLSGNLIAAGVDKDYAYELAIYLDSAYRNGIAVFLVGPNGQAIANAFSISTFACKAGILNCAGEYSEQVVNELASANDKVVVVTNPFGASWSQILPDVLTSCNKFFVLTAPYSEDLQVEPKGIANYALPVLTEFFVEKNALTDTDSYLPGKKSAAFNDIDKNNPRIHDKDFYSKLKYHTIAVNNFARVFTDADAMVEDKVMEQKFRYLFGLVPAAYLSDRIDVLDEQLERDSNQLDSRFYTWLKSYVGDDQ